MFLTNNPEYSTAQEISELRGIKKNLVSVYVEKLVNAGLLERGPVEGDRRKVSLTCTDKAGPIIEAGRQMQEAFYKKVTDGIPDEDWAVYKRIEEQMMRNARKILK